MKKTDINAIIKMADKLNAMRNKNVGNDIVVEDGYTVFDCIEAALASLDMALEHIELPEENRTEPKEKTPVYIDIKIKRTDIEDSRVETEYHTLEELNPFEIKECVKKRTSLSKH